MRGKTLPGVLFLLSAFTACSLVTGVPRPASETGISTTRPSSTPVRSPAPPERIDRNLESQIAAIAEGSGGKVGVGAVLVETGDSAWLNREGHFVSQSVYKLPIAMAVMKMVSDGRVRIDQDVTITPDDFVRRGFHSPIRNVNPSGTIMPVGEIVRYSLSESDGTASDVLLELAGGPTAVQNYLRTFGITDFIVADSEKLISKDWETQYRNWATPQASIDLLRSVHEGTDGLNEWTTSFLLSTMTFSETGGRRLKRGLPEGATIAHKTGTGGRQTEVPGFRRNANSNISGTPSPTPKMRPTPKAANSNAVNANTGPVDPNTITSATNDIGIITLPDGRHILIAVYVQDSAADAWTRERVIADIAKAVCDKWMGVAD
ncbi:MAG: serine hydrolase [Acidobacteriota bacterium]